MGNKVGLTQPDFLRLDSHWKHGNIVGLDSHNGHELNSVIVRGGNVAVK